MDNISNINQNPYENEKALNELVKMMKRQEKITVSFKVDENGYECAEVESKRMLDKFLLQLSLPLYLWLIDYIRIGVIGDPVPSSSENLRKDEYNDSNEMVEDLLADLLRRDIDASYLKILPEIIDKPGRLTVLYAYQFGCLVFKVKRSEKIMKLLEEKGF